jgi:hypothetical protein
VDLRHGSLNLGPVFVRCEELEVLLARQLNVDAQRRPANQDGLYRYAG